MGRKTSDIPDYDSLELALGHKIACLDVDDTSDSVEGSDKLATLQQIKDLVTSGVSEAATGIRPNLLVNGDNRISQLGKAFTATEPASGGNNDDVYITDQWTLLSDGNAVAEVGETDQDMVSLLLHCDGADASTTFTDKSRHAHTVTATANAQVDTAQSKYGGASALFDGTGDLLSIPNHAAFQFGSGDFCIEFALRINSLAATKSLFGTRSTAADSAGSWWSLKITTGGQLNFFAQVSSVAKANYETTNANLTTGVWYQCAFARSGTDVYFLVDGVLKTKSTTTAISTNSLPNPNTTFEIGGESSNTALTLNGWLDEIRITKGLPRTVVSYTAPTAAFTDPIFCKDSGILTLRAVTASKKFGIVQFLPNDIVQQILQTQDKNLSFAFSIKANRPDIAGVLQNPIMDDFKAALLYWTGTKDSLTSDVVSAWNANGSDPTLATSWASAGQIAVVADATVQRFNSDNLVIPDTATNVALFIWVDYADTITDGQVHLSEIKLELGASVTDFVAELPPIARLRAQRFVVTSFADGVVPGTAVDGAYQLITPSANSTNEMYMTLPYPVPMLFNPSVTAYDNLGASGKVYKGANGKTAAIASSSNHKALCIGTNDATSTHYLQFNFVSKAQL